MLYVAHVSRSALHDAGEEETFGRTERIEMRPLIDLGPRVGHYLVHHKRLPHSAPIWPAYPLVRRSSVRVLSIGIFLCAVNRRLRQGNIGL